MYLNIASCSLFVQNLSFFFIAELVQLTTFKKIMEKYIMKVKWLVLNNLVQVLTFAQVNTLAFQ